MSAEKYVLSRGVAPSTRLLAQHWLLKDHFGWNLHPSAAQLLVGRTTNGSTCRVVDVACGNGIWLIEESRSHPTANFLGLDVSGAQFPALQTLPDNLEFAIWDFNTPPPSDLLATFDIVHIRFVVGAIRASDPVPVLDHLIQLLKPNGILQWDEAALGEPPLRYPPGHSSDVFIDLFKTANVQTGSRVNVDNWVSKLGSMFRGRGLQHVQERRGGEYKKEMWTYWAQMQIGAASEAIETLKLDRELLVPLMEDCNNGIFAMAENLIFVGRKAPV